MDARRLLNLHAGLVIGVDGCHLKNKYGGIFLAAIATDPNDQYLPLAFAVVESENKECWTWFMTLFLNDVDHDRSQKWDFISDQQKVYFPLHVLNCTLN